MAARPGLHAQFGWTGGGLSSVSNSCPLCTYLKTLIGKARYGAEWGIPIMTAASPGGGGTKVRVRRRKPPFVRVAGNFRFHIPHLSCSVLRSPLLLSAREVISCVYVALPIKGSSLAGTAGCEARLWVGVGKDVMAAWPSIFNSSGDFFRAPCHRLTVTIIAGQSHTGHTSPNRMGPCFVAEPPPVDVG
ncbi:hypothetical protein CH63R_10241 [Colletotrichum higginsianum IMI 349063]|uniref:Uncharacterized protein n=1 Tax=Colletotrichum higginsianum (strain IMI 349063) TaxID=759273 RepID=A0A1B7Y263_COLHI|nr:uncharacterized protein CH63R_10241 [Colletotrichum higginsianum IMI 349063]OBR06121.1 hypothetical protein CH63R_10241 [Colletotrichum higginsianum IMI 349063]